jgi:hypothetical protein
MRLMAFVEEDLFMEGRAVKPFSLVIMPFHLEIGRICVGGSEIDVLLW